MRKFYLKIEKEKWTAKGGSGGKKDPTWRREQRLLSAWSSAWRSDEKNERAAEHIPEGLRKRWPAWNWNTNAPRMDWWREEREGTRRRRDMSRLCAASGLCEKRLQTELNKIRFLTPRAQPGFFSLNRQHFVFSCTSPSSFFVYSKRNIYNFNLFI